MYRVLIGSVFHETNTFWPYPTGHQEFEKHDFLQKEEMLKKFRGTRTPLGGLIEVMDCEGVEIVPSLAALAEPSGIVTKDVFDTIKSIITSDCKEAGHLDGILLSLHGAMVTEEDEDGEGALLAAIRRIVGDQIPIIATLDLHTNLSQRMVDHATAFFPYREYPHADMYARGLDAGNAMAKMLRGEVCPVMRWKRIPILPSLIATAEESYEPIAKVLSHYNEMTEVLSANYLHAFYLSDTSESASSVLVITDGDDQLAESAVAAVEAVALANKEALSCMKTYSVDEAVAELSTVDGTAVFADVTDNPGSGSSSDGTTLLRRLLELKVDHAAVATIYDPESVEKCHRAGVGAWVELSLGGKKSPEKLGEPIKCRAYVKLLSDGVFYNRGPMHGGVRFDLKRSAVVLINGISVIIGSNPVQAYDIEVFQSHGLMLNDFRVLVVKSAVHYRAAFGSKCAKMFPINCPGMVELDQKKIFYQNIPRPVYPLDEI